ncbi:MAG: hypothetical protein ACK5LT_04025 [Lachnospirales bacterium]
MITTQRKLETIMEVEGIEKVAVKGQRKSEHQKLASRFHAIGKRLEEYKKNFEIMRTDRNSYRKTDTDVIFMRTKDDHMMNDQLKPCYNLQFAVENYFIIHTYISNNRTDYNTLTPVVEKHKAMEEMWHKCIGKHKTKITL